MAQMDNPAAESLDEREEASNTLVEALVPPGGESDQDEALLIIQQNENTENSSSSLLDKIRKCFLPTVDEDSTRDSEKEQSTRNGDEPPEDDPPRNCWDRMIHHFGSVLSSYLVVENPGFWKSVIILVFLVISLQVSYLSWGYLQELIMTTKYNPTPSNPDGRFPSAMFCVWINRITALSAASLVVVYRHWGKCFKKAPLMSFSPCALSNTLSSYFQYASLRYVPFPVMTIFRSSKIITVMLMGKLLHGTKYATSEWIECGCIVLGVSMFSISSRSYDFNGGNLFSPFGYAMILGYLVCDSFTSQWQIKIYETYGRRNVDPFQMMLGVNLFGIGLTTIGLLFSGDVWRIVEFLEVNPQAMVHLGMTGLVSASGQIATFAMIREFGAVLFTVVITIRQMGAIVLSAVVFGHSIMLVAMAGAVLVFATVAYQIKRQYVLARQPETLVS
eukprot:CAMPEP_0197449362 /NCGR_PEP_ID=MMETSP1175-20131217/21169_1 /TAXON_ID=1003142 /ORGANISM="Triceratium dubium, Strain CCMP147" /LENGTH=445 /DNA_ID=CAMNT_0042981467 /DNA_START=88 /DNA_END=1425 /DNA_ORIENTATION=+